VDALDFDANPRAPSRGTERSNKGGDMGMGVGCRGTAHGAEAVGELGPPPPSLFSPLPGRHGARSAAVDGRTAPIHSSISP
jgi:hypothetical protein